MLMDTVSCLHYYNNIKVHKGDIVRVRRGLYWHYGIVFSNAFVIHYSSYPGHWWQKPASIRIAFWNQFLKKKNKFEIYYAAKTQKERDKIIERALCRLGEEKYSLFFNNCKSFVDDCMEKIS